MTIHYLKSESLASAYDPDNGFLNLGMLAYVLSRQAIPHYDKNQDIDSYSVKANTPLFEFVGCSSLDLSPRRVVNCLDRIHDLSYDIDSDMTLETQLEIYSERLNEDDANTEKYDSYLLQWLTTECRIDEIDDSIALWQPDSFHDILQYAYWDQYDADSHEVLRALYELATELESDYDSLIQNAIFVQDGNIRTKQGTIETFTRQRRLAHNTAVIDAILNPYQPVCYALPDSRIVHIMATPFSVYYLTGESRDSEFIYTRTRIAHLEWGNARITTESHRLETLLTNVQADSTDSRMVARLTE